jgi:cation transport ATPase
MALLMSVAVVGALIIGQWPETAVVIWVFGLAELIEALSLERARNAIRSLVALAPETALVRADGGGWVSTPTGDIRIGGILSIKPGERIALDGTVTFGTSTVNQAPITGESVPVAKEIGSAVFAGTINERGTLEVTVTAEKGEGTLDRIARSIQAAQAEKTPAHVSWTASPRSTHRLCTIAPDKTGTLTHGKPGLTDLVPIGNTNRDHALRLAASLDTLSEHPVAHAIVTACTGTIDPGPRSNPAGLRERRQDCGRAHDRQKRACRSCGCGHDPARIRPSYERPQGTRRQGRDADRRQPTDGDRSRAPSGSTMPAAICCPTTSFVSCPNSANVAVSP